MSHARIFYDPFNNLSDSSLDAPSLLPSRAMLNPWLITVIGCAAQDGPTRELRNRDIDRGSPTSSSRTKR
ncbi:hypothetical protein F4604DRAFT_1932792 [Suillus subluteus]|nr:hypothetical protein F4604DRAFT_1932792 [Suillus subluteus]